MLVIGQLQEAESTYPLDTGRSGMWLEGGKVGASPCPGVQGSQIRLGGADRCHPRKSQDKRKDVSCGQNCSPHAGFISGSVWTHTKLFVDCSEHPRLTKNKQEPVPLWAAGEGGDAQRQPRGEDTRRLRRISAPCPPGSLWQMRMKPVCLHSWVPHGLTWLCRYLSSGS